LVGSAAYRAQSEELKSLSILAFQRLWNRNNPSDGIDEDGVYGASTKARLGMSPVEGFETGACPPGSGGIDPPADSDPDVGADVSDGGRPDVGSDAQADAQPDAGIDSGDDIGVDGNDDTGLPDRDVQTNDTPPNGHADTADAGRADTADERTSDGGEDRPSAQPVPLYSLVSAGASPNTRGCTSSRNQSAHWLWLAVLAALRRRR
jgi:hypothetical protein